MQTTSTHMRRRASGHNLKAAALAFFATLLALPGQSAVIPDIPLQAGRPVPPNIMFILDDSGSMHWEMMPDSLIVAPYVFPRANSVYGGSDYANQVATVLDSSSYNARTRSPQVNKIFYNPSVTYQPWLKSDGSSFPNASPSCALHNPEKLGTGTTFCRDLTSEQTNFNNNAWCTASNCDDITARNYWPATYYWHNGGSFTDRASYTKVEIRAGSTYTGNGRAARFDCVGSCSYEQEIQNFANWYTYYRSRILSARAGIGRAFAGLAAGTAEAPASRIGYATINTAGAVQTGVRDFTGTNRTNFFSKLYGGTIPQAGTPLRRALDDVGRYYQTTTGAEDPWGATPGVASDAKKLSCRASYSILMTDGYWTNDAASAAASPANGDTEAGLGAPFEDGRSNTLADVAMHYWKTDLRDMLTNDVPTSDLDPANWQHMVTFGVGLGVVGTITRDTAFAAIATKANVSWPDPTASQPGKIDDLLHASVNSRGDFFSASDPKEFAEGLSKVLTTIGDRVGSGSNVAANSVALRQDTKLFQASYKPGVWTGELQAFGVTAAGVGASSWSASQGIPAVGRKLFTSTAAGGAIFPTPAQITSLGVSPKGHSISAYLAGSRLGEIKGTVPETGDLRRRPHLLGDIVNSSPAYVKETDTLFVGANDGMMHAINATTGAEVFAYVPNATSADSLAKLKLLSAPAYSHQFYVDGPVTVSSYLDTPDKNYLVGALGRGGKGVYFLDVTSPATFGIAKVTGEYAGEGGGDMGFVLGKPIVASALIGTGTPVRTPVAIVSNGVNSTNGSAALFVFNIATGALIKKIVANSPTTKDNGLSTPRGWDSDGDGNIDNVYAGDLLGNVWKFDISSNKISDWGVDLGGTPLFVARDSAGTRQPITGGLSVALDPVSFKPYVFFGTGKYLEQSDVANTLGEPNLAIQSWYGLRDDNAAITGRSALQQRNIVVAGAVTVADPTGAKNPDGTDKVITRATRGFETYAELGTGTKGWYVDLVDPPSPPGTPRGERMVGDPFMLGRVLVAASIIPNSDPCAGGGTGFLNAIDAFTGTSVKAPFFDANGNGSFDDDKVGTGGNQVPIGSLDPGVAMPTSPTIIETLVVVGGSTGATTGIKVNNPLLKARISWREILGE